MSTLGVVRGLSDRFAEHREVPQQRVTPITVTVGRPTNRRQLESSLVESTILARSSRSRCIQRARLGEDLGSQKAVQRLLGHQIDFAAEEFCEFVLQLVDGEAEASVRRHHVQQVDVAVACDCVSNGRPERGEFDDAEAAAGVGEPRQIDLAISDQERWCSAHGFSLAPSATRRRGVLEQRG